MNVELGSRVVTSDGEDVGVVDKLIVEELSDPLMHMIRTTTTTTRRTTTRRAATAKRKTAAVKRTARRSPRRTAPPAVVMTPPAVPEAPAEAMGSGQG